MLRKKDKMQLLKPPKHASKNKTEANQMLFSLVKP